MVNTVSVKELFSLEPFTEFKVLAGWSGRNREITAVKNAYQPDCLQEIRDWEKTLIDIEVRNQGPVQIQTLLQNCLENDAGAITLTSPKELFLPKELLDGADQGGIPIIHIPGGKRISLAEGWQRTLQLKSLNLLNPAILWSNGYILKMLNSSGGLEDTISYLEMVLASRVVVTNSIFDSMIQKTTKGFWPVPLEQLLSRVKEQFCQRSNEELGDGEQIEGITALKLTSNSGTSLEYCYLAELKADQACYGFLIGISEEPWGYFEQIQLKRAAEPLVSYMIKQTEIMETEKKYKENFLYDLLNNNFECHQSIVKQGQLWGWNLANPHQLLIIEAETGIYPEIQLIVSRYLAKQFKNPIMAELSGQLVVLIPDDLIEKTKRQHKEYIKGVAKLLQGGIHQLLPKGKLFIGIGRYYNNVCQLCRSFQEAKTALELGKYFSGSSSITHFEDLGIMRLLASVRYEQLSDFAHEYLEELIAFDKENKTNLVDTLQIYFQQNGDFKAIANQLYIHANTLRYRLKKIEEMLEINLQNSEDNLNLLVALKIMAMGQKK